MDHKIVGQSMSLLGACKDYFGLRADQKSAIEFGKEYKALTPEDRQEMRTMLMGQGYNITELAVVAA